MSRESILKTIVKHARETVAAAAFFLIVLSVATGVTAGLGVLGSPLAGNPPLTHKPVAEAIEDGATP
ncbi:hypothetical protein [Alsobacter sp. R-9]